MLTDGTSILLDSTDLRNGAVFHRPSKYYNSSRLLTFGSLASSLKVPRAGFSSIACQRSETYFLQQRKTPIIIP